MSYYETDRGLAEYLLFHYGEPAEVTPPGLVFPGVANFPARCVAEGCDPSRLPANARGLDLGCAVGRASFELARHCTEVVGIDYSERFVTVAAHLRQNGSFIFARVVEGDLTQPCQAIVPPNIQRERVRFQRGDALELPEDLGGFDVVLLANLLDRLRDPRRCLARLPGLVNPGGQLIITSPYTWLQEHTPRENWLGGFEREGRRVRTQETLQEILAPHFEFRSRRDFPFLIREHERKSQLCIAEATVWLRR